MGVHFDWPGGILVNGARCGAFRAAAASDDPEGVPLWLVVGFLGSFTTFSTFGKETVDLLVTGHTGRALLVMAANLALGLPAIWLGARLGR